MDEAQKWRRLVLVLGMVLLGVGVLGTPGEAGELGHYVPSLFNVRDFVMPPKGVYAALYGLYYTSDEFRDRNGNEVNSITIRERSIELDVDLDLYSVAPAVLWNTGFRLLGADYGMFGGLPFGGPSIQAALALGPDLGIETDESAFGLQDLIV